MDTTIKPDPNSTVAPHVGVKPVLAQGWTQAKVIKALYNAGSSPQICAQLLGVGDSMVSRAVSQAESRAICYFVAGVIGVSPGAIWPQFRTHRNGGVKIRGRRG